LLEKTTQPITNALFISYVNLKNKNKQTKNYMLRLKEKETEASPS
jgi:hypothetical protein